MSHLRAVAPDDQVVTSYDRTNLAVYAAMLDAEEAGADLFDAASDILGISGSRAEIEVCWSSHLERAKWIIGDGLPQAVEAFGNRPD